MVPHDGQEDAGTGGLIFRVHVSGYLFFVDQAQGAWVMSLDGVSLAANTIERGKIDGWREK